GGFPGDRLLDGGARRLTVVRVHALVERVDGDHRIWWQTKVLLYLRVPHQHVERQVAVPQSDLARVHRQFEPFLGQLAIVNVDDRSDVAFERARSVHAWSSRIDDPAVGSVGSKQAMLELEWRASRVGLTKPASGVFAVVGVHRV